MSGVEDAVIRNIEAVNELTSIVQSSFGPNGGARAPQERSSIR